MHHHHPDLFFPVVSGLIAVFGSWTALDLFRRARTQGGLTGLRWMAVSAVAMGVSIWSMHFVAMLGFDPGGPATYDVGLTALSLLLAVVGTGIAFALAAQERMPPPRLIAGGLVMGLSIGTMHYVGMAALRTAAVIDYQVEWVVGSIAVALLASTCALIAARDERKLGGQIAAALLLGLGIVAMHYTAMAGVELAPTPGLGPDVGVDPLWLGVVVAGPTLGLLFLALGAGMLDEKQAILLALRSARVGYWEMSLPHRRLRLSDQAREMLGLAPGEAVGPETVSSRLTEESAAQRARLLDQAIATGGDYETDYALRSGGWLQIRARMVPATATRGPRLVGTIQDVTREREAFSALARSEARQRILIDELNHRVKNTLATILSLAALTGRKSETIEAFRQSFEARLLSLSQTHNILTAQGWERADVRSVFAAEFAHYDADQVTLEGPEVWLASEAVLGLGLVAHELATNAAKYGALSVPAGRIRIAWSVDDRGLVLAWRESGGPPPRQTGRKGFGSRLIASTARSADLRYTPQGFEADIILNATSPSGPRIPAPTDPLAAVDA
jgi:NO-binding membrane sensor protein with MHYT domain/two-component sensor histidine kinase